MNKIIFSLTFVCAMNTFGMKPEQKASLEIGFTSQHYRDFLVCHFAGNVTPAARATYLNYCMKEHLWSFYTDFLSEGGTSVVAMAEKPATDSLDQFIFARSKIIDLAQHMIESCKTFDRLEEEYKEVMQEQGQSKKKKKKRAKGE